ncbi:hypothetical protein C8T65DRAFT_633910 [Cerioporus squamosus]|nr:hypothetical protein C8T65DRAFT_633910 [Cerioporus squamosus]
MQTFQPFTTSRLHMPNDGHPLCGKHLTFVALRILGILQSRGLSAQLCRFSTYPPKGTQIQIAEQ